MEGAFLAYYQKWVYPKLEQCLHGVMSNVDQYLLAHIPSTLVMPFCTFLALKKKNKIG